MSSTQSIILENRLKNKILLKSCNILKKLKKIFFYYNSQNVLNN